MLIIWFVFNKICKCEKGVARSQFWMQFFYITDHVALKCNVSLRLLHEAMKNLLQSWIMIPSDFFYISSGSPINKQKSSALQSIISTLDLYGA